MLPGNKPRVLLIEADPSLKRLIALGLQNRGVQVVSVPSSAELSPVDLSPFDLLVLDIDRGSKSDWTALTAVSVHTGLARLPIIALSWEAQKHQPAGVVALNKPFDARLLHYTIDHLLVSGVSQSAEVEAAEEKALLAAYHTQTSPSLLPLLTAAGLLIAVIGMLLQFAIAAVGFLVVIAALLLWTLGARSRSQMSRSEMAVS